MNILEAQDLRVARAGREVVALDRLALGRGETLAILGPNGAGKTTLVLGLASLLPSSGRLEFAGAPVTDPTGYRRRIAVVFQRPLLLDRSVRDNVMLGLALRGVPRPERERGADRWLERLGIAHLARRSAVALSGGEAQRVSLARALAIDPEILFLDEPFSALDAPTRESLLADLAGVLRERRVSAVVVTHDRDEALSLADHIAVLMAGRLRQYGSADNVFSTPADPEVAAFVGVENVLPARVTGVSDELTTLSVGGQTIEVTAVPPAGDDSPLLCLRPDDVVISLSRDAGSARNVLRSRIVRLEPLGRRVRVVLDCGFPLVAHITLRSARELELAPGQEVSASFKATVPHLLPRHGPTAAPRPRAPIAF
jgi:tungstate transport system ATP-binding protein